MTLHTLVFELTNVRKLDQITHPPPRDHVFCLSVFLSLSAGSNNTNFNFVERCFERVVCRLDQTPKFIQKRNLCERALFLFPKKQKNVS